jgi:hypothetical protein
MVDKKFVKEISWICMTFRTDCSNICKDEKKWSECIKEIPNDPFFREKLS